MKMTALLFAAILFLTMVYGNDSTDCSILIDVIPECSCQGAPPNIIIRCNNMNQVPRINGSYAGIITEFSMEANTNLSTLPDNAFDGLRIQYLNLYGTSLNNISDLAFNGMSDLLKLSVSGDSEIVPPITAIKNLHNLTTLHLHRFKPIGGNLEGVHLFNFPQLKELILDSMQLRSMASDVFSLPKLTTLQLIDNMFTSFPSEPIHALTNLKKLVLTGSSIAYIPSYNFQPLTNMTHLDLSRNNISNLEENCFNGLKLSTLDLSNNQLSTLSDDVFQSMTSLKELHLENQRTASGLYLPSFSSLTSLQKLYLQSTQLDTNSTWQQIKFLTSLTSLNLHDTGLTYISAFVFSKMEGLVEANFADNNIATIEYCVFSEGFNGKLSLANNPLHCDCNLQWLKNKINNGKIEFITNQETCSSPAANANKLFADVKDFDCTSPLEVSQCPSTDVTVVLTALKSTLNTINFNYLVSNLDYVEKIKVAYTNLKTNVRQEDILPKTETTSTLRGLDAHTNYEICLQASKYDNKAVTECKSHKTSKDTLATTVEPAKSTKQEGSDTGIIIGAVIAGIILLALLAAIIYILFIKQRSTKSADIKSEIKVSVISTKKTFSRPANIV